MNMRILAGGTALVGFAAGAAAGYFFCRQQLEKKYEQIYHEEVEEARQHYAKLYKRDEYSTPAATLTELKGEVNAAADGLVAEIIEKHGYHTPVAKTHRGVVIQNIREEPYIITEDEFMDDVTTRPKISLEYYATDEVLLDEDDSPVEDVEAMVGSANLGRFGFRSGNPNVVYIRNDRLEMDFEVTRREGSYKEMMGE